MATTFDVYLMVASFESISLLACVCFVVMEVCGFFVVVLSIISRKLELL